MVTLPGLLSYSISKSGDYCTLSAHVPACSAMLLVLVAAVAAEDLAAILAEAARGGGVLRAQHLEDDPLVLALDEWGYRECVGVVKKP